MSYRGMQARRYITASLDAEKSDRNSLNDKNTDA